MEFHISKSIRERLDVDDLLFSYSGNVVFANVAASRKLAYRLNELQGVDAAPDKMVHGAALFAMGLIDELSHALVARYRAEVDPAVLTEAVEFFRMQVKPVEMERLLLQFTELFPNSAIFRKQLTAAEWLDATTEGMPNTEAAFEELIMLWLANSNPAFRPFKVLFDDVPLKQETVYQGVTSALPDFFITRPTLAPGLGSLLDALRAPMLASPDSLTGQLDFIRERWAPYLGDELKRVMLAIDTLREEEIAIWMRFHPAGQGQYRTQDAAYLNEGFEGDQFTGFGNEWITAADGTRLRRYAAGYQAPLNEYEAFSADQAWMPTVVLIAKNTYVWLEQLSKKYLRHIYRLDQIPDEELQTLATRGMTGLWLIGLWERSRASRTVKRLCGNADAVASAYSLMDYRIADDLGGEEAYKDLRDRAARAGLRLASDMVPNHMGIDSTWVIEQPDMFLSRWESPFPSYTFEGPDLSADSRVEIKVEDHYYDQSDAAVVFRIRHHQQGTTRYMYHGNDGTTFAWNDTAQLDYSKATVREYVTQVILNVARRFPIIRFDAAMVLAKRHVQRLWFPLPGAGGSIPSRAEDALSDDQFNELMPHEFWREVVDRVAAEVPGTLLLAEAFWLLEGYFVRTLGMHRVYNSAFMNMLRDEENAKYRSYLKKTVEFDPDILKRYVNFMSNPDERTAIDQFGSGDKYFGVSVLLATLPGLPMFGHGQVEGFTERYGMDFKQARMEEIPDQKLVDRHQKLIAPLLKNRRLFAESTYFVMYDFWNDRGAVDENVFAYSNRHGDDRGVILYNNSYESTYGTIHTSVGYLDKGSGELQQTSVATGINLPGDSYVIGYRDDVAGLEYLRRASDFRDQGLSMPLRGYQHVALLHWRELKPTAAEPWDVLSDVLNGAGVWSVQEALAQLRLRPLIDVLKQVINPETIATFAQFASETKPGNWPDPYATDPRLEEFALRAKTVTTKLIEMWDSGYTSTDAPAVTEEQAAPATTTKVLTLAQAALRLPSLSALFPPSLATAVTSVLPTAKSPAEMTYQQVWAPVLAYLVLKALPTWLDTPLLFDHLNLRPALADTFCSVGLEGEAGWRAAAQLRVLLQQPNDTYTEANLTAKTLWDDPDVRWLAGVTGAPEDEYVNKEGLERLLSWLTLPSLLKGSKTSVPEGEDNPANLAQALVERAAEGGWKLKALTTPAAALPSTIPATANPRAEPLKTKSQVKNRKTKPPTAHRE